MLHSLHRALPLDLATLPLCHTAHSLLWLTHPLQWLRRALCSFGAIVTRLQAIEEMAGMNMLCSDKTGGQELRLAAEVVCYCCCL